MTLHQLIKQHVAEKHAMNLHAVVSVDDRGGAEVEGFSDKSRAVARAAESGAQRALYILPSPVARHVQHLGAMVDSEFADLH